MMSDLREPDAETLYDLLNVKYGSDTEPPTCRDHSDEGAHRHNCATCGAHYRWYRRMSARFKRRGFRFHKMPRRRHDPRPQPCADSGHRVASKHRRSCDACRAIYHWDSRQYNRQHRRGVTRSTTDLGPLIQHLDKLEQGGLIYSDVAAQSGVNETTIRGVRAGTRTRVYTRVYDAIMAIPVPERRVHLMLTSAGFATRCVDSTGTARRIGAARRAGHSISEQATRLGWVVSTVVRWTQDQTVPLDAADAVAALYPELIANPGSNSAAASRARTAGLLPARYFSEANIDDPGYEPMATIREPLGLRRRLRALAWLAHGPEEIAPEIGEPVDTVRAWLLGGRAPAYANHLVVPVYERWSFTLGENQQAADLARHQDWPPPLAWDDVDMDNPRARPHIDIPTNVGKTKHVLTSVVFDALDGQIPAEQLLRSEKVQVVSVLHRRGWSDRRIAAWLRWHPDIEKGYANVCKFREREGITGYGIGGTSLTSVDKELILWGAAA